jgi:hypothetical protein
LRLKEAAGLGEVIDQVVASAEEKTRLLLGIDQLDRLEEEGNPSLRIPRVVVDGRQVDQRPAGQVPLVALQEDRDRSPQEPEGLLKAPLISP